MKLKKITAVAVAIIMAVSTMAFSASAAVADPGGNGAGTNGVIVEDGIWVFKGTYTLKKEQSGTHYNIYNIYNYAIPYNSHFSFDKFTINCTSYSCTVGGNSPPCHMSYKTYVTKDKDPRSEFVGSGFYAKYLYGKNGYVSPVTISTKTESGEYLQVECGLYCYQNASYCYMRGDYKVY